MPFAVTRICAEPSTWPAGWNDTCVAPVQGLNNPGQVVLSINQVHHDNVPMPMPDGAAPTFAWTFQPPGCHFNPPVEVEYPNMSGLRPGEIAIIFDDQQFTHVALEKIIHRIERLGEVAVVDGFVKQRHCALTERATTRDFNAWRPSELIACSKVGRKKGYLTKRFCDAALNALTPSTCSCNYDESRSRKRARGR